MMVSMIFKPDSMVVLTLMVTVELMVLVTPMVTVL